jgi:hypothetical protein
MRCGGLLADGRVRRKGLLAGVGARTQLTVTQSELHGAGQQHI